MEAAFSFEALDAFLDAAVGRGAEFAGHSRAAITGAVLASLRWRAASLAQDSYGLDRPCGADVVVERVEAHARGFRGVVHALGTAAGAAERLAVALPSCDTSIVRERQFHLRPFVSAAAQQPRPEGEPPPPGSTAVAFRRRRLHTGRFGGEQHVLHYRLPIPGAGAGAPGELLVNSLLGGRLFSPLQEKPADVVDGFTWRLVDMPAGAGAPAAEGYLVGAATVGCGAELLLLQLRRGGAGGRDTLAAHRLDLDALTWAAPATLEVDALPGGAGDYAAAPLPGDRFLVARRPAVPARLSCELGGPLFLYTAACGAWQRLGGGGPAPTAAALMQPSMAACPFAFDANVESNVGQACNGGAALSVRTSLLRPHTSPPSASGLPAPACLSLLLGADGQPLLLWPDWRVDAGALRDALPPAAPPSYPSVAAAGVRAALAALPGAGVRLAAALPGGEPLGVVNLSASAAAQCLFLRQMMADLAGEEEEAGRGGGGGAAPLELPLALEAPMLRALEAAAACLEGRGAAGALPAPLLPRVAALADQLDAPLLLRECREALGRWSAAAAPPPDAVVPMLAAADRLRHAVGAGGVGDDLGGRCRAALCEALLGSCPACGRADRECDAAAAAAAPQAAPPAAARLEACAAWRERRTREGGEHRHSVLRWALRAAAEGADAALRVCSLVLLRGTGARAELRAAAAAAVAAMAGDKRRREPPAAAGCGRDAFRLAVAAELKHLALFAREPPARSAAVPLRARRVVFQLLTRAVQELEAAAAEVAPLLQRWRKDRREGRPGTTLAFVRGAEEALRGAEAWLQAFRSDASPPAAPAADAAEAAARTAAAARDALQRLQPLYALLAKAGRDGRLDAAHARTVQAAARAERGGGGAPRGDGELFMFTSDGERFDPAWVTSALDQHWQ